MAGGSQPSGSKTNGIGLMIPPPPTMTAGLMPAR